MKMPKLNVSKDRFDEVAGAIYKAIRGEPGAFHVYVDTSGLVRVLCVAHKKHRNRVWDHRANYGEIVGTYTRLTPLEYIEDDILEEKRRRTLTGREAA